MILDVISPELLELVENKDWKTVREILPTLEPVDISELINRVPADQDKLIIFRLLPKELAADTFSEMPADTQEVLVHSLSNTQIQQVLAELDPDDRTRFIDEMPPGLTRRLLDLLSAEDRKETLRLLGYPEFSIGRLMTPDYIAIKKHWTVAQAIDHVRKIGKSIENFDTVYVTDAKWQLLDALPLRNIILADDEALVESVMDNSFISLSAHDDQEQAVHYLDHYNLSILPVVDASGILLGSVTFDDVVDVMREETTEDIHKSASVAPLESSYPSSPIGELYSKRIVWLLVLVFVNVFSGAAMASFEGLIQKVTALIFFLPLIIGSSGNAGSQAATLVVRAMAMNEIDPRQWWRLVLKDVLVSGLLGLTMGAAVSILGILRGGLILGLCVSLSMLTVVVCGSLLGTVLPFVLRLLKQDPAAASSPLITSISDILGVFIFFGLSSLILGYA